jgi:hypothetical protein
MVRDCTIQPNPAKPAICQIEVDLFTEPTLRTDPEAVADQQHPDHQLGIYGWPADAAVEARELASELTELDKPVYRAKQVIRGNVPFKRELIEQRSLIDLPMSHHDLQSCRLDRLNH